MSSLTVSPVLLRQLAFPSHALPLDSASLICGEEEGAKVTYVRSGLPESRDRAGLGRPTSLKSGPSLLYFHPCTSGRIYCKPGGAQASRDEGGLTQSTVLNWLFKHPPWRRDYAVSRRKALRRTSAGIAAISRMDLAELESPSLPPSFVSIPEGDSF